MSNQKYIQLASVLKKRFKNASPAPDVFLPSENQIGSTFSVSRMTARRALQQLEMEGLVYSVPGKGRMLAGGHQQGLVPHKKTGHPLTIGIYPAWPQQRNDVYFAELLNGLWAGSSTHPSLRGRLLHFEKLTELTPSDFVAFVQQEGIDGLANILASEKDCPAMTAAKAAGIAVATVNRTFPESGLDWVSTNHRGGAFMLTEYLLQLGHRQILHVTQSNSHQFFAQRLQGYREALAKYGLSASREWIAEIKYLATTVSELEAWGRGRPPPSAVFVAAGAMLRPTLDYLNKKGLKAPEDVSVVTFDEVPLPPGHPKITCVRQEVEKMGKLAVDILMRRLQNSRMPVLQMWLDPVLIWGDSVKPVKGVK